MATAPVQAPLFVILSVALDGDVTVKAQAPPDPMMSDPIVCTVEVLDPSAAIRRSLAV